MKIVKMSSKSTRRLKKSIYRQIKSDSVRGLHSFFERMKKLKPHRLCRTNVVVDGDSLIRYLTRPVLLGKQFINKSVCLDRFEKLARTFLLNLKLTKVSPIVVFSSFKRTQVLKYNNVVFTHKSATTRKSQLKTSMLLFSRCHSNNLFLFREQLVHTLNEFDFAHLTTQLESPNELVSIANQLRCPVVSSNNIFFILPVNNGFIPLSKIHLESRKVYPRFGLPITTHQPFLKCRIFNIRFLTYRFQGRQCSLSPRFVPVFATLCGNHIITQAQLKCTLYPQIHPTLGQLTNQNIMQFLFSWLQNFRKLKYLMSCLKFLLKHNARLYKYIKISINSYRIPNIKTSKSTMVTFHRDNLKFKLFELRSMTRVPGFIKQRLQNGLLSPLLLNGFINGEVSLLWKLFTVKTLNSSLIFHTDLTRNMRRECYSYLMQYFPEFTKLTERKTIIKQVSNKNFDVEVSKDVIRRDDLELFDLAHTNNKTVTTINSVEEYTEALLCTYLREINRDKSDLLNLRVPSHRRIIMKLVYWMMFHDGALPPRINYNTANDCQSERLLDVVNEFKGFYFFFNQLMGLKLVGNEDDRMLLQRNVLEPSAVFTEKLMEFLQLNTTKLEEEDDEDEFEKEINLYQFLIKDLEFLQIKWFKSVLEECLLLE